MTALTQHLTIRIPDQAGNVSVSISMNSVDAFLEEAASKGAEPVWLPREGKDATMAYADYVESGVRVSLTVSVRP